MKPTTAQQQALLALIGRIYSEIRQIEETYGLQARPDDFRPRIEYFHDVVRALTQNAGDGFERTGRLSVESLARDIAMLRQIADKPLVRHPELQIPLSPGTQVAVAPETPATVKRIDIGVAATLGEGYSHYALLFVALLAYPAERNYMNRLNESNEQLEMIHDLLASTRENALEAQINTDAFLAGITDPELRNRLLAAIVGSKKQRHASNREVMETAQKERDRLRAQSAALEDAHMRYASSQLILYQGAQALVKKMAAQGLNIVGEFVETAVQEAQGKGGRGF